MQHRVGSCGAEFTLVVQNPKQGQQQPNVTLHAYRASCSAYLIVYVCRHVFQCWIALCLDEVKALCTQH